MTDLGELYAVGPPFDDEQRAALAGAILNAAEQLEQGATVNELGRVVLEQEQTPEQDWEDLARLTEQDAAREVWLGTVIKLAGYNVESPVVLRNRILSPLQNRRIRTVRDLLILGWEETSEVYKSSFGNLRQMAMAEIRGMLEISRPSDEVWHERPSMEQIARLSDDLSQVPAYVLQVRKDILDTTAPRNPHNHWHSVQEVLEVLSDPTGERAVRAELYGKPVRKIALAAATQFAAEYEAAKARI